MDVRQIGFATLLVAVVLVTLVLVWGPLVLLYRWKDPERRWYLTGYLVVMLIALIASLATTETGRTNAANPLATIIIVLAWRRVYKAWRTAAVCN